MPKKSLTPSAKEQLDVFVQKNYPKLMHYALHLKQGDDEGAEVLLHDTLIDLYEGRRSMTKVKHPLAYFQLMLRSVNNREQVNRQASFENGIDVCVRNGASDKRVIRECPEAMEGLSYPPFDITSLDREKHYQFYRGVWKTFHERRRWLLDQLEANVSTKKLHPLYQRRWNSPITLRCFQVEVSRVLRLVTAKMAVHLQDAG